MKKYCKTCKKELPKEFDWLTKPFYRRYGITCPECLKSINSCFSSAPQPSKPRRCLKCNKIMHEMAKNIVCNHCIIDFDLKKPRHGKVSYFAFLKKMTK